MDKANVTISMFFEVKNAEIFGGEGSVGYTELKSDICVGELKEFDIKEYAKTNIKGFAGLCKVPEESVRIISRQEYEENTEE